MLLRRPFGPVRVGLIGIQFIILAACAGSQGSDNEASMARDSSRLLDTLAAFEDVRGVSGDSARHVAAATDALHGAVSIPAPLVVKDYRREDGSILIDLTADSLPRLKWTGAGGTVRILADGRRAILQRHN